MVVAQMEQLGLEDHPGHAARALASDLELADELVPGKGQVVVCDRAVTDLLELGERDLDRALDVLRAS